MPPFTSHQRHTTLNTESTTTTTGGGNGNVVQGGNVHGGNNDGHRGGHGNGGGRRPPLSQMTVPETPSPEQLGQEGRPRHFAQVAGRLPMGMGHASPTKGEKGGA